MAYMTIKELASITGRSIPAIRKALNEERISPSHVLHAQETHAILIAAEDSQVQKWMPPHITDAEVTQLRRDLALAQKRVRQAERRAARAEKARVRAIEQVAAMTDRIISTQHAIASVMMTQLEARKDDGEVSAGGLD